VDHDNYWGRESRLSRRGLLRAGGVAGIGIAGAALIGCGSDDESGAPSTPSTPGTTPAPGATAAPDAGAARQGGTLGLAATSPQANFNPVINWHEGNQLSGIAIYDRLISPRVDERVYVLEAAESVEIPDDTTVVFKLKPGLVYQAKAPVNGRAVEAEDIVTMQRYSRDEEKAENRAFQTASMESVEAPDDQTVVFRLQQPNAYLFSGTQLGLASNNCIIPRELVLGDFEQSEPVGSGPYQMKSYQFQVRYEYERNPTFRGAEQGLPYIDTRVVTPLTDNSALEAAFRGRQIEVHQTLPAETQDRLIRDLGDQLTVSEFTALALFTRNMSKAKDYFEDMRVREAFYRWFDPQQYIDLVANGHAVPVPGQLAVGLEKYQLSEAETADYKRYDPAEAKALLDAAGFDYDRVYDLTTITGAVNESALQVFEDQVRQVGVKVSYKVAPASEWLPNITNTGDYDFCLVQHPGYDTPATPLRLNHTESLNINAWMGIRDPEIDAMIEASEQALDPETNVALVKDTQRALLDQYAHLSYVYTAVQRELRYAYIKDWETTAATHPMYRTEAWIDA
jgi:peptide/nickel transport system substrate-binding protein